MWETPQDFFDSLDNKYHFNLDPCCTEQSAKCEEYYTEDDDGLSKDWSGHTVFCNPPYSRKTKNNPGQEAWIKKCYEESLKPNTTVVALLPVRTDTKAFHAYILGKAEIHFVKGRLHFGGSKDAAPFPSMWCVWQ